MEKFDKSYLDMAAIWARNSYCKRRQVGAIIVKDGNIVSTGCNTVTLDNDPTAHAEVNAIRKACAQTGNFKLDGCVVYSSCEPCPMCLSALYWAGVKKIYYGNTKTDARDINFDDKFIYDELEIEPEERHIPSVRINLPEAILAPMPHGSAR